MNKNLLKYKALYIMFLPGFAVLVLNNYLPIFGVFVAFKEINYIDGILGSPWAGFRNFEYVFASPDSYRAIRNTVLYSLAFMIINMILAVGVALLMNELRTRLLAKVYQSLIILPNFLSMVVVSYLVLAFLSPDRGFINESIIKLFTETGINWYSRPEYWPYILTFVNAWKGVGIGAVVYIAAIAGIDPEYYEAAVIDGASRWQQAINITVPTIRPIIIIITLLTVASIFNADFGLFYQVTLNSGSLYSTTDVIDTYVYRALINLNDIGMSSAVSLLQSTVGFLLVILANAVVRKVNRDEALF